MSANPARTRRRQPMSSGRVTKRTYRPKVKDEPTVIIPDEPPAETATALKEEKPREMMTVQNGLSMFYMQARLSTPTISIHKFNPGWNL